MKKSVKRISLVLAMLMSFVFIMSVPASASSSTYVYYTNKGTPNYNYTNLSKLYNSGSSTSWYSRIYSAGCFVTSYAMMLRNMNKLSIGAYKDIRSGVTGRMIPDPYTVTYANTNCASITYDSSSDRYTANYSEDPVVTYPYRISSAFDATYSVVDMTRSAYDSTQSMSIEEKAYWIAYYIRQNSQGVGIVFQSSTAGTHIIVGVETTLSLDYGRSISSPTAYPATYVNPIDFVDPVNTVEQIAFQEQSIQTYLSDQARAVRDITYGSYFTVCDPVNYSSTPGQYVNLNSTWTATVFTLDDVVSLRIFA